MELKLKKKSQSLKRKMANNLENQKELEKMREQRRLDMEKKIIASN